MDLDHQHQAAGAHVKAMILKQTTLCEKEAAIKIPWSPLEDIKHVKPRHAENSVELTCQGHCRTCRGLRRNLIFPCMKPIDDGFASTQTLWQHFVFVEHW